jgi:hypothetical protein
MLASVSLMPGITGIRAMNVVSGEILVGARKIGQDAVVGNPGPTLVRLRVHVLYVVVHIVDVR